MKKGLEFERRVGQQMRLDYFKVASSNKLDHQKRDFVVTKKNAGMLPFPVDIQFTTRFNNFKKMFGFIKRQDTHPRRKRLYVQVHHPKGVSHEQMLLRIEPVAQAIETAIMDVQHRPEGIFILSIEEDNHHELFSLKEFVERLEATGKFKQFLEAATVNLPSDSTARVYKKIDGEINKLTADGFYIRGSNGILYWATYGSFVPHQHGVGEVLRRIFITGNASRRLRRRTRRVLFEPIEEWHEWDGKHFRVAINIEKVKK